MPSAPTGFPTKTLGELIESGLIRTDTGFACGQHNNSGQGVLQVRPFNITPSGRISLSQQKHVPALAASGKPTLAQGDVLFNNTNTKELVGKTAVWTGPEDCVFSNHMTRIRVLDPMLPPRYLATAVHAHWLTGRSQMLARSHVAQASILGDRFHDIEVPWPAPPEQATFAQIFDLVDKSLAVECEAAELTDVLKRATMDSLFTRGLRGEPQKETELGLVPESWAAVPVGALGAVKGGKRMPKGIPLVQEDTGRPYIRVTDFEDHAVRQVGILFVPRGYEGAIKRYRISSRDVYISIAGTIGLVGQVPDTLEDANLTENAAKIVFSRSDIVPRYVMYALASRACQEQIARATAKNAQPKLALTRIEQLLVPLPPTPDEQEGIVVTLDVIDRKVDLHRRKRVVLENLLKTLLHKLMTGEIRAADLDLSALSPSGSESAVA